MYINDPLNEATVKYTDCGGIEQVLYFYKIKI